MNNTFTKPKYSAWHSLTLFERDDIKYKNSEILEKFWIIEKNLESSLGGIFLDRPELYKNKENNRLTLPRLRLSERIWGEQGISPEFFKLSDYINIGFYDSDKEDITSKMNVDLLCLKNIQGKQLDLFLREGNKVCEKIAVKTQNVLFNKHNNDLQNEENVMVMDSCFNESAENYYMDLLKELKRDRTLDAYKMSKMMLPLGKNNKNIFNRSHNDYEYHYFTHAEEDVFGIFGIDDGKSPGFTKVDRGKSILEVVKKFPIKSISGKTEKILKKIMGKKREYNYMCTHILGVTTFPMKAMHQIRGIVETNV